MSPEWLMKAALIAYALPLGLLTSRTDLEEWHIYDKHIIPYLIITPLLYVVVFAYQHAWYGLAVYIVSLASAAFFAWVLLWAGVWFDGDAFLFTAYSTIIPDPIQLFANTTLCALPIWLVRRKGRHVPLAPPMFCGFILLVLFGRWLD